MLIWRFLPSFKECFILTWLFSSPDEKERLALFSSLADRKLWQVFQRFGLVCYSLRKATSFVLTNEGMVWFPLLWGCAWGVEFLILASVSKFHSKKFPFFEDLTFRKSLGFFIYQTSQPYACFKGMLKGVFKTWRGWTSRWKKQTSTSGWVVG